MDLKRLMLKLVLRIITLLVPLLQQVRWGVVYWSDGRHFPWWLWLANIGKLRDVANYGISHVRLRVTGGFKCLLRVTPRVGDPTKDQMVTDNTELNREFAPHTQTHRLVGSY